MSDMLRALLFVVVLALSNLTHAQQPNVHLTPEDIAFNAVRSATNPAARLAAAEDFITNFPQSSKRSTVARLVAEQLPILRNMSVASSMVDRARAIFTGPDELEFLRPVALEVYANVNRTDEAFALAAELLASKPEQLWILQKMTYLGAQEARYKNLKHAQPALRYGLQAIEIMEQKLGSDSLATKTDLARLYQQIGIINLAEGKEDEAKTRFTKAIVLNPQDPSAYALLGRLINAEYEKQMSKYRELPEGNAKVEERKLLDKMLDEIIDAYAHSVGLARGKVEQQGLIQQIIPDLTRYYKDRHNGSITGLQKLIEKYKQ